MLYLGIISKEGVLALNLSASPMTTAIVKRPHIRMWYIPPPRDNISGIDCI